MRTYEEMYLDYATKQKQLEKEKALLDKAEKKLAYHKKKYEKMKYDTCTKWECIIYPLVKEIKERCGFKYAQIYGCFGLDCQFSIYFANEGEKIKKSWRHHEIDDNIDICNVDTWSLDLRPSHENEGYEYYIGENKDIYEKGSIGYLNGFNKIYKPLPNTIEEIIKLLHFEKKEQRTNES